jgi:hypothetical protein
MENISRAKAAEVLGCTEEELEGFSLEELSQLVEHLSSIPKADESEKEELDLENYELFDVVGRLVSKEEQEERWLAQVEKEPALTAPPLASAAVETNLEDKPCVVYREYRSINSHDPQLLEQFLLGRHGTEKDCKAGKFLDRERFMNLAYEHTSIRTSVYTEAGLALDLKCRGHDVKLNHVVDVTTSKDFMEATVKATAAAGLDTDQVDMSVNGLNVEYKRWYKPQFHIDSDGEVWLWLCSARSHEQWQEPRHYYVIDYIKGWDLRQYAGTKFYTYSPAKHSTVVFDLSCTELKFIKYQAYNRPFPERTVFAKLSDAMTYAEFLTELEA